MKKIGILLASVLCVGTAAAGLSACGDEDTLNVQSGTSTTLITSKSPGELSPENAVFAFLQKQSELSSYKITTEGKAVADLAGYEQEIHNTTYKNGSDYLNEARSESWLVKMKHQAFSKEGKVVYRDSFDGEMSLATKENYKSVYGFTADDVTLGGYIINEKTLRYATLESSEGDTLTYYLRLAGDLSYANGASTESATALVRLQAKAYGSLDSVPIFSDVDLHLTIKTDWTPVSYTSECSYDCKKVFNMTIAQTLTCTYSDVNAPVGIPSVEEFNQKLGSTPSDVLPGKGETSALAQLTSAFGATLDENKTAVLPLSVNIDLFGAPLAVGGELSLKLRQSALEEGNIAEAFVLRLDMDLNAIPLLSQYADTLTVRYSGEGEIYLMLNDRSSGKDRYLFTYALDLNDLLPLPAEGLPLKNLQAIIDNLVLLEKTAGGYHISLREDFVGLMNASYEAFLTQLETALGAWLGEPHGYIRAFLGTTFSEVSLDLNGAEKITSLSLTVKGTPTGNVTMGEKIDVSIDTKLMCGAFAEPFTGELDIRFDPTVLWTGDYYALAKAHLHLDLTPASPVFMLLGMVGSMIPDLPSWLNPDLTSLDVYYAGDGILTLAFSNKNDLPMGMIEVDLKEMISQKLPALGGATESDETQTAFSLLPFTLTVAENGITLALGEPVVQAIAAAYSDLVESLIAKASESDPTGLAGMMLGPWLRAEITGVEVFLGTTAEGKLTFDLAVFANYTISGGAQENGRFIGLTVTYKEELTETDSADLAADKALNDLKAANEKATEYAVKLQELIDGMDVSEGGYEQYVAKVTALQDEIAGQDPAVTTLMPNGSYLAEKTVDEKKTTVLLLTAELYHERAEQFKAKAQDIGAASSETDWDELNAIYDKSATISDIVVPAVKESAVLKAAVGKEVLDSYLTKRKTHETKLADELIASIATATEEFNAPEHQNRDGWTNALTKIVTEFKPVYDKLPEDLKEKTGYQTFVKLVYNKNIKEVLNAYNKVKTDLEALYEEDSVSFEEDLLPILKDLAGAYAWGFGYDYWQTNTIRKVQPWGTWVTALKPTDLSEEEQAKVTELNELNRSFMKGAIATEILNHYNDLTKAEVRALYGQIKNCRIVVDGKDTWNFETLENKEKVLEKIHALRFLTCKVLPGGFNNSWGEEETVYKNFVQLDLTKYEEAFVEYLESTSND